LQRPTVTSKQSKALGVKKTREKLKNFREWGFVYIEIKPTGGAPAR